jgi:hypothetical protein
MNENLAAVRYGIGICRRDDRAAPDRWGMGVNPKYRCGRLDPRRDLMITNVLPYAQSNGPNTVFPEPAFRKVSEIPRHLARPDHGSG